MMKTKDLLGLSLVLCTLHTRAQHDPGRGAVRLLAKGDVAGAMTMAAATPKKRNSPISDAEHHFVLAMAMCQKDDPDGAFLHAQQAVDLGLPAERFAAGPRDVFGPLYDHPGFSSWLEPRADYLLHGPMLGAVTDRAAHFWVRTAEEADVKIAVASEPNAFRKRKRFVGEARTAASSDFTAVVKVEGLASSSKYTYQLFVNDKSMGVPSRFLTFPPPGESTKFSMAFGGGAGFTPQYEHMWKTIAGHRVDALLLLGDNVYIDDPEHALTQRYCYYRRQSQPDWRSLIAAVPVYTIYDDHDFGLDDCVPGPDIESPPWKRSVWEVYQQNWVNPAYGGGEENPGCWYDFHIGDVHFIMLDCRYYRDLKGGSMLGTVQKKWLFHTLQKSKGTFKVLASSVPFSPGVKGDSKDTWDGFPDEREEIFSFIENQDVDGVVLMSADRHRTDLRRIPRPNGYDFYEVMSSRLTNVHTHDLMERAKGSEFVMGYNETPSFGLMEFNTAAPDPCVTFSMIAIDGENKGARTIPRSELSNSR